MKTSNKVLIFMGISLILFTITMIVTFWVKYSVPDSLVTSFYALFLSEAGFLAWIRTIKRKYREDEISDETEDDFIDEEEE